MIKPENMPMHVSIIPDGNRRWAREKGLVASEGHRKSGSYEHIRVLFDEARRLGIKYLSFWGFSTENWKREKKEIEEIFRLVLKAIEQWRDDAHENKIRFRHFGRKDRLPKNLVSEIEKLEKETEKYSDFNVCICLDYGGRDEIVRAVNKILGSGMKKIDEKEFAKYLDSFDVPDPDLIIRTSAEYRTSGFMPFQSAYSEWYFADVHFPDFDACELRKSVEEFSKRKRNLGR